MVALTQHGHSPPDITSPYYSKASTTLITDGCPPILVETGGPELASIGTGDVLAGMIGALWARGLDPKTADRFRCILAWCWLART